MTDKSLGLAVMLVLADGTPVSAAVPLPVAIDGDVTITGPVSIPGSVEVSNDVGNPIPVTTPTPAAPITGSVTVAAAETSLPAAALANGVILTADEDNTSTIWVGATGLNTTKGGGGTGYPLKPGASVSFAVANVSAIKAKAETAGAILYYAGS